VNKQTDTPRPVPVSEWAAKEHLYGCRANMFLGMLIPHPHCVIDTGDRSDCTLAANRRTKWTCPYWRLRSDAGRT